MMITDNTFWMFYEVFTLAAGNLLMHGQISKILAQCMLSIPFIFLTNTTNFQLFRFRFPLQFFVSPFHFRFPFPLALLSQGKNISMILHILYSGHLLLCDRYRGWTGTLYANTKWDELHACLLPGCIHTNSYWCWRCLQIAIFSSPGVELPPSLQHRIHLQQTYINYAYLFIQQ